MFMRIETPESELEPARNIPKPDWTKGVMSSSTSMRTETPESELEPARNIPKPDWSSWIGDNLTFAEAFFEKVDQTCLPPPASEYPDVVMMLEQLGLGAKSTNSVTTTAPSSLLDDGLREEQVKRELLEAEDGITADEELLAEPEEGDPVSARNMEWRLSATYLAFVDLEIGRCGPGQIKRFLDKYATSIRVALITRAVKDGKALYRLSEDGFLEKAWEWVTALAPSTLKLVDIGGSEQCEAIFVILHYAYSLNPDFAYTLKVLADGIDAASYRKLLILPDVDARTQPFVGIYALHPPWNDTRDPLDQVRRTGRYHFAEAPPLDTPMYLGMSQHTDRRWKKHITVPINSRVMALSNEIPLDKWDFHLIMNLDNGSDVPSNVLHAVEHILLAIFRATESSEAGLNVNLLDRFHFAVALLSWKSAKRMIRIVNNVMENHPSLLLPYNDDDEAWQYLLEPAIPPNCLSKPKSLMAVLFGSVRSWIFKQVQPTALAAYVKRNEAYYAVTTDLGESDDDDKGIGMGNAQSGTSRIRPRSEAHVQAKRWPMPSRYNQRNPIDELKRIRELVEKAALSFPA